MGTGKTKRIRNNPSVTVQPCSFSGKLKPGTSAAHGTAELVQSGAVFDEVRANVRTKYGFQSYLTQFIAGTFVLRRKGLKYADTVVLVRLDA